MSFISSTDCYYPLYETFLLSKKNTHSHDKKNIKEKKYKIYTTSSVIACKNNDEIPFVVVYRIRNRDPGSVHGIIKEESGSFKQAGE